MRATHLLSLKTALRLRNLERTFVRVRLLGHEFVRRRNSVYVSPLPNIQRWTIIVLPATSSFPLLSYQGAMAGDFRRQVTRQRHVIILSSCTHTFPSVSLHEPTQLCVHIITIAYLLMAIVCWIAIVHSCVPWAVLHKHLLRPSFGSFGDSFKVSKTYCSNIYMYAGIIANISCPFALLSRSIHAPRLL